MNTLEEIQQIAPQISLTFDNPESVKVQVKQIKLAQKQLRVIKKEINATIRNINQQASQSKADSIFAAGLDVFGKRKWAGTVRAATRRAVALERETARQPYLELKEVIDNFILKGNRLKLMAEEYLLLHKQ